MALAVYKGVSKKSYENSFFREFAGRLVKLFELKGWNGVLIANSMIKSEPTLQIDALLVSEKVICVIDLKNFGGRIKLPDKYGFTNKQWENAKGLIIKGGNSLNPFIQLTKQRKKLSEVLHNELIPHFSNDRINVNHIKMMVCFQKKIDLYKNAVPDKYQLTFYITDVSNVINQIADLLDIEGAGTNLSPDSLNFFPAVFEAPQFRIDEEFETVPEKAETFEEVTSALEEVIEEEEKLDADKLHPDQKEVLLKYQEFLISETQNVFVLQGSTNSGKTYIIPYFEQEAFKAGFIESEIMAQSSRAAGVVARTLNENVFNLYSHIYDLRNPKKINKQETIDDDQPKVKAEDYFPLIENKLESKSLLIIDEAQLIGNSYSEFGFTRFGTGYLLQDLIDFIDFKNSKRKLVVIGDLYITTITGNQNALSPKYLEELGLVTSAWSLKDKNELYDELSITGQALDLVAAIRNNRFNRLVLKQSNEVENIQNETIPKVIKDQVPEKQLDFKVLTFSNQQAHEINKWVKKNIVKTGTELAIGDLLLLYKSAKGELNEPSDFGSVNLRNGYSAQVKEIGAIEDKSPIKLKGRESAIIFNFQDVTVFVPEIGKDVKLKILLNLLYNTDHRLTSDEELAFYKILLDKEAEEEMQEEPLESSSRYYEFEQELAKTRKEKLFSEADEAEKKLREKYEKLQLGDIKNRLKSESPYQNCGFVRFGWAMTVHRSIPMKYSYILLDALSKSDNRGVSNQAYFEWLYTGITRSKQKLFIANHSPYNWLKDVEIKEDSKAENATSRSVKVGIDFLSDLSNLEIEFAKRISLNAESIPLVRFAYLLENKIGTLSFEIKLVRHAQYAELYEIESKNGESATLTLNYNKKYKISSLRVTKCASKELENKLNKLLEDKVLISFREGLKDSWKLDFFNKLSNKLVAHNITILMIDDEEYNSKVSFKSLNDAKMVVEFVSKGDGFFTYIKPDAYEDETMWQTLKAVINEMK